METLNHTPQEPTEPLQKLYTYRIELVDGPMRDRWGNTINNLEVKGNGLGHDETFAYITLDDNAVAMFPVNSVRFIILEDM